VVAFYFSDLLGQARGLLGLQSPDENRAARRLWLAVIVAFIPSAIVGLLLRDFITEVLFETPEVIAGALIVGGIVFLVLERMPPRQQLTEELSGITLRQALGVGFAQLFALIPGMSRSGSSIVGGLLSRLNRRTATAFSFYLSIPTLSAATLVSLLGSLNEIQPADWGRLLLGAVVAMIVGYVTIGWLLRFVSRNSFVPFGIYRIIVGVLILGLALAGVL
jgi:undecaprenyl-diphosphatase